MNALILLDAADIIFSRAVFKAKPDTWFDAHTRVQLIDILMTDVDGVPSALFSGTRQGKEDEELCSFCEFEITWPEGDSQ